jgi:hypothetical protein
MAYQKGIRYYPDYYDVGSKKLLLDPSKSWQENVWYFVCITAGIWLSRSKVWSYDRGLIEELEQTCRMRTYLRLRDIVCDGLYDRRWSFYLNCRGAAWAAVSNCIAVWKRYALTIPDKLVSIDAPIDGQNDVGDELTVGDSIASHEAQRLRTVGDFSRYTNMGEKGLDELEQFSPGWRSVWSAVTEEAWEYYQQSCVDYGLEPMSKEDFLAKNFPPRKKPKPFREKRKPGRPRKNK